ncbi:4Fe-4S dicluster domain-containing protein [candidate division CSSED10-310 bacterium]|uniref:4Fe-4S dicluster domain-containing protein n=1 Tax=candidate division CSSED10-310 bacterium TaxID=2855610 RepID=A0ABV6Z4H2_UNCC1
MAKQVHQVIDQLPEVRITNFMWDRCAAGKGYREFTTSMLADPKIQDIRLNPTDQVECGVTGSEPPAVCVKIKKSENIEELQFDMVVFAPLMKGNPMVSEVTQSLQVELDKHGFVTAVNEKLRTFSTRIEGVFVAGTAHEPKDIQESSTHGAAAAGGILSLLVPGRKLTVNPATAVVDSEICGGCKLCPSVCTYKAIEFDQEKRVSIINELLCRGCGACAAFCPSAAIEARHFTDKQIWAEIESCCLNK